MSTKRKTRRTSSSTDHRVTAYARDVVSGRVIAGPHVRNACQRHIDDLASGGERGLRFDAASADRAIEFFETVLMLSEGQFAGLPFLLHPSQVFIIGSIFGWLRADGTRRFRRAYIEQGKGNGKSPLAAGIGLYGMMSDGEPGAQVYAAAAKREQAGVLFADAVKMVRQSPALSSRATFSGGQGREFNIAHIKSSSFFRPVSRDTGKTGSGPRPYFVLADEIHELPDRSILETLERGFKFRRQPLLFMITNSGTDRNSIAWEEHAHSVCVAAGSADAILDPAYVGGVVDDVTFAYVCALDDGDDPLTDPACWAKANPLLGVTITDEYLAEIVEQAKAIPGKLNGILRLHFCVWTDADEAWMTRATLDPALSKFDPMDYAGETVYLGLDLSQNRDITALGAVVKTGENDAGKPTFHAWVEAWTPGDTIDARELRDKLPYRVWRDAGYLHAPPGASINYQHVAQLVAEYDERYNIAMLAYDRYAFRRFEAEVESIGLSIQFAEHPQGGMRKGKPICEGGEGLWMPGSVRLFEDALLEGRVTIIDNPVLVSAIMSCVSDGDRWGNNWLSKAKSVNKIDAAIALIIAFGAAHAVLSEQSVDVSEFLDNPLVL